MAWPDHISLDIIYNAFIFGMMHHFMLALSQRVTKPRQDPTLILKRETYSRIVLLNWFTESLIRLILTNFYIFRAQANDVCARAKHVQLFSHVQLSGCALELIFLGNFLFSLVVLAFICLVL